MILPQTQKNPNRREERTDEEHHGSGANESDETGVPREVPEGRSEVGRRRQVKANTGWKGEGYSGTKGFYMSQLVCVLL